MNVNKVLTMDYKNISNWAKRTQFKPNFSQKMLYLTIEPPYQSLVYYPCRRLPLVQMSVRRNEFWKRIMKLSLIAILTMFIMRILVKYKPALAFAQPTVGLLKLMRKKCLQN
jgi:hypothetical protein